MSSAAITPGDSRYVPFVQQPFCCVPTSIQIIMNKLGLPLIPQELLGFHLGLTVPPEKANFFWNVRVSDTPPTAAGWGTQIQNPDYAPNTAFQKLNLPLRFTYNLIDNFATADDVRAYVKNIQKQNKDCIVCFRYGTLYDTNDSYGHASVFDRYLPTTDEIRLIDPETTAPKWRTVPLEKFYKALKAHGSNKSGGFWEIDLV